MMRRKYLAQYGNSKVGPMNTVPVAVNTNSYLHKKYQCCTDIVKNVSDRTAGEKIEFARIKTIKCSIDLSDNQYVAKNCNNRDGEHDSQCSGSNVVITKNVRVAIDQGQHIENVKSSMDCSNNFWGAAPRNNGC